MSTEAFVEALSALEHCRRREPILEAHLYCTRAVGECPVTSSANCRDAVMSAASRDVKAAILGWISKRGPFIDDDRQAEENDYFEFEAYDVTDQGLGEAARRVKAGDEAGVFSFPSVEIDFERDPLIVQQGLSEEPIGYWAVANVWTTDELEARARASHGEPRNWAELLEDCRAQFDRLEIPDAARQRLEREVFYPAVARRVPELLRVLQDVMTGREDDGSLNPEALSLWETHTQGNTAWFSDESDQNKRKFRDEMSFPDPDEPTSSLFCSWHGKIRTQQFRIHFEWPVPVGQARLKVPYIGPKITKS